MSKSIKRTLSNEPDSDVANTSTLPIQPSRDASEAEWIGWRFETKWNELNQLDLSTESTAYMKKVIQTICQLQPLLPFLPHTYPTPNFTHFLTNTLPKLINQEVYQTQVFKLIEVLLLRLDTPESPLSHSNYESLLNLLPTLKNPNPPKNYPSQLLNTLESFLLTKSIENSDMLPNFQPTITHYIIQYIKQPTSISRPPPHELFFAMNCLPLPSLELLIKNALECDRIPIQKFILSCLTSGCLQGHSIPLSLYPHILNLLHKHTVNPSVNPDEALLKNLIFLLYYYGINYPILITESSINYEIKLLEIPPLDQKSPSPTFGIDIFKRITSYLPRCWNDKVRRFGYLLLGSLAKIVFNFPDYSYNGEQPITNESKLPPWKINQIEEVKEKRQLSSFNFKEIKRSVYHLEYLTSELNREFIDHRIQNPIHNSNKDKRESSDRRDEKDNNNNNNNDADEENDDYQPTQGDYVISDTEYKVLSSKVTGGISFGIEDLDHLVRISSLTSLSILTINNPEMIPKTINYCLERLLDPIELVSISALNCLIEISLTGPINDKLFSKDQFVELMRPLGASNLILREKIYELIGLIKFTSVQSLEKFLIMFKKYLKPVNFKEDIELIIKAFEGIGSRIKLESSDEGKGRSKKVIEKEELIIQQILKSGKEGLNFPIDWDFAMYSLSLNYLMGLNDKLKIMEWNSISNYHQRGLKYAFGFKEQLNISLKQIALKSSKMNNNSIQAKILSPLPNQKDKPKLMEYSIGVELKFELIFSNLKLNEQKDISLQIQLSDNSPKLHKLRNLGNFLILGNNEVKFESNIKFGCPSIEGTFLVRFNLVNDKGALVSSELVAKSNDYFKISDGGGNTSINNDGWGIWLKYKQI